MSEEKFQKSIGKLRAEVSRLDREESAVQKQMEALIGEIEEARNSENHEQAEKLMHKLKETIAETEVKHPALATALEEILWTLSNMGI